MQNYLSNILNKIQQFNSRLDNKSVLTDKQWVVIDDDFNNKKVYIFRTNGELLVSTNGDVHKATFEVLNFGNVLIEDVSKSYLYNHGFLDTEILILRKDGSKDFFTFVSHELYANSVQDTSQLAEYLQYKYLTEKRTQINIKEEQSSTIKNSIENKFLTEVLDGTEIYIEKNILREGLTVVDEKNKKLKNGIYRLKENKSIVVENGIINSIYYISRYDVKEIGEIIIEQKDANAPEKGDKAFHQNWSELEDGEYRLSWIETIYVQGGRVIKRKLLGF